MVQFVCNHCGQRFQGYGVRKYCSKLCFAAYRYQRKPHKDGKPPSQWGENDRLETLRLYKEGHSYKEIAVLLGRCEDTVKSWRYQDGWNLDRPKSSSVYIQKSRSDRQEAYRIRAEGYTYQEIADELGRSTDTVKSWGYRYGWTKPRANLAGIRAEAMRLHGEGLQTCT